MYTNWSAPTVGCFFPAAASAMRSRRCAASDVPGARGPGGEAATRFGDGGLAQQGFLQQQFTVGVQAGDRRRGQQCGEAGAFGLLGPVVLTAPRGEVHPWFSWGSNG